MSHIARHKDQIVTQRRCRKQGIDRGQGEPTCFGRTGNPTPAVENFSIQRQDSAVEPKTQLSEVRLIYRCAAATAQLDDALANLRGRDRA